MLTNNRTKKVQPHLKWGCPNAAGVGWHILNIFLFVSWWGFGHRGWEPYDYPDTNEGYEDAKANLNSSIENSEAHKANGKELYGIYCAVCHGNKGDGQGILMTREKFLGVPSYADREITPGSIHHVLMYGKNAMGSHAGQVNAEERWQIAQHVMELRSKLVK